MLLKVKIAKYAGLIVERRFDFLLQAIAWSVPRWFFFYNHAVYVTTENPTWMKHQIDGCEVRLATPDDMDMLLDFGISKEAVLSRFAAGDRAAVAIKDGKIVTAIWAGTCRRFLRYNGTEFDPGADGVFYYSAYTDPSGRTRGYYSSARAHLHQIFAAEGRRRNWAAISANYPIWLAAVMKRNYKRVGETFYFKIFFINICYYKKWHCKRPRFHVFFKVPPEEIHCI